MVKKLNIKNIERLEVMNRYKDKCDECGNFDYLKGVNGNCLCYNCQNKLNKNIKKIQKKNKMN